MTKGFDCATPLTALTAKAMVDAGLLYVARYLVPEGPSTKWKRMSGQEAQIISNAGMKILSVYETTAGRPAGGAPAGTNDGAAAYAEARRIGQPEGSTIYFTADFDANASHWDSIEAYLRAAQAQLGKYKAGIYGEFDVVEEMARRKACFFFWQTYAWSGGKLSKAANVYQYKNGVTLNGVSTDLDQFYGNEGMWTLKAPAPTPAPTPAPSAGLPIFKAMEPGVMVDGHLIGASGRINEYGVTWIPLRIFGEALGASVSPPDSVNHIIKVVTK